MLTLIFLSIYKLDKYRFYSTTQMNKGKEVETDGIMYGIRLQLATPATLKVNQFIPAVEFIAW